MASGQKFVVLTNIKVPNKVVEIVDELDSECSYKLNKVDITEKMEALYQARKFKEELKRVYPNIIIKVVQIS